LDHARYAAAAGRGKPIQRDFTVLFCEILIFPRKTDTAFHPATMKSCVCFCIFEQGRIVLKTAVFRNGARQRENGGASRGAVSPLAHDFTAGKV
jgi:hypothetical protein